MICKETTHAYRSGSAPLIPQGQSLGVGGWVLLYAVVSNWQGPKPKPQPQKREKKRNSKSSSPLRLFLEVIVPSSVGH
jgi:hypothetical protein